MKKSISILAVFAALSLLLAGCTAQPEVQKTTVEKEVTVDDKTYDGTGLSELPWALINYDLSDFNGKTVKISFSCEMKVTNNTESAKNLMWQLTLSDYPVLGSKSFEPGATDWTTVTSSEESNDKNYTLGEGTQLYLSNYGLTNPTDVKVEVRNFKYNVSYTEIVGEANWLDESVPSIKEAYEDIFDSIGIACEYDSWAGVKELSVESVRKGIAKHADSVSMGNELKPESIFGYQWTGTGKTMVSFKASDGKTYDVPKDLQFDVVDKCLDACKKSGLKMRGHVLAWHAQTPEAFFTKNYAAAEYDDPAYKNILTNRVSKEEMSARLEWYIKTVLEHVANWEAKNNNGEHIIWAWDVFNETVADDATATNWVRGSTTNTKNRPPAAPAVNPGPCGSRWYQCYEDTDFIVDAFRFANAYAPADVKLCYNDYNEYMNNEGALKTDGIISLIKLVQAGSAKTVNGKEVKPRIDVVGLQSHVGVSWPGAAGYETALKRYLELVDVHVTELDISCTSVAESKSSWTEYMKMLKKYGNSYTKTGHKITNLTFWGINNKSSWIYKGDVKYPLLFDNYYTTPAFWAVINAAK